MEEFSTTSLDSSPLSRSTNLQTALNCDDNDENLEPHPLHQSADEQKQNKDFQTTNGKRPFNFFSLPGRSKYVLMLCTMAEFIGGCAFSIPAPFYPLSAERKGMTLAMVGFIFGIFSIIQFFVSPLVGNFLTKMGPKCVYIAGMFVAGISIALFGTLDAVPPGTFYVVLSILLRSTESIGCAALQTASFAIVSSEFPDSLGTVYAIVETGSGAGFMAGPAIGGFLYDFGGYGMPFYLLGILFLLNAALVNKFLPKPQSVANKPKGFILSILCSPLVIVSLGSVILGGVGIGALDTTLAQRMELLNMTTSTMGLCYMIAPGVHTTLAPLLGYLVDNKDVQAVLVVLGHGMLGLGYTISGPSFFLSFLQHELWTLLVGLALIGSSIGCAFIPTMAAMVKGAVELGYQNDIETHALVSGLFMSGGAIGVFLGSLAGGAIVQQFGYPVGYGVVAVTSFIWMLVCALFFTVRYFRKRNEISGYELVTCDADDDDYSCKVESIEMDNYPKSNTQLGDEVAE